MVEASSSLTKLLVTNSVLSLGQLSLQSFSLVSQATAGVHVAIFFMAVLVGVLGGFFLRFKTNTVNSLNVFLYLAVLMTAINLLQYALPGIVKAVLLGLLAGSLFAIQSLPVITQSIKTRFGGIKLNECLSTLGIYLPLPIVQVLTIVWHNPKPASIFTTVHCAVFTSLLIYQLNSHSINAYAQEIDAIIEELRIEGQKSVSSDPENANKNDQLSESEQAERRKDKWRYIGIRIFEYVCLAGIPLTGMIRNN